MYSTPDEIFNPELCAAYVESLVQLDEVERALLVLDNLPAYYRDNPPLILAKLRNQIISSLCTTHTYMVSNFDQVIDVEVSKIWMKTQIRGILLEKEVSRYNEQGISPHIVDVGPGEYLAPVGLKHLGYQFTYQPIAVDGKAFKLAEEHIKEVYASGVTDRPGIFLGLEIIEHLPSPQDLAVECLRYFGSFPERVHFSTPRYTFDIKPKDWRKPGGLPHLRAYTPNEFINTVSKLFPRYNWEMYPSQLTSLRGVRSDTMDAGQLL